MALKAGRVGVNPNYVDKEGRPLYDNSYLKELLRKEGIITLFTKEGNPISIDNAVAGRVYDLVVNMSPKQAGTGTPSPTNVREISGYTGLTITVNGTAIERDFDTTVYGGTDDITGSGVTVTWGYIEFDGSEDEVWGKFGSGSASAYAMQITPTPRADGTDGALIYIKSNYLESIPRSTTWGDYAAFCSVSGTGNIVAGINTITSVDDWKAYLAEHPLQVAYVLFTSSSVSLTPQAVTLVTGSNTVSSDTGTTTDLKYLGTLVPGGANGRSLNRSLNLNREVIDREEKKEIQEETKEEVKEVPVEEPVTVKKSTKKSTK